MSDRIPAIALNRVSDAAKRALDVVAKFVEEECIPADPVVEAQTGHGDDRWEAHPPIIEDLKDQARKLGLWNMFLPKGHYAESPGWTNLEYGLMAEWMGRSRVASEATNCAAPDTGNMEVLAKYGNAAQKQQWLKPLMDGHIRSAFLMTEPQVASSDARNIELSIRREGDEYVLNGQKWWSSGAGDPRCKLYIVMGKTDANHKNPYQQQSVILVSSDTPGITIDRMLKVYGYDDAPHGHGHLTFKNVRVPASNMVLGEGRGFEIIQGRLGPGRIHHAMRCIGAAERALDWMLMRANDEAKKPFGKLLREQGVILEWIAKSRIEIDSSRLIVLNAAIKMDELGAKAALKEIAEAKVLIPQMALTVIDRAVQAFGGAGVCQDTPLAYMWAGIRTLRLADGPDEVHLQQMGRNENKRAPEATATIKMQKAKTEELFKKYRTKLSEPGANIQHKSGQHSKLHERPSLTQAPALPQDAPPKTTNTRFHLLVPLNARPSPWLRPYNDALATSKILLPLRSNAKCKASPAVRKTHAQPRANAHQPHHATFHRPHLSLRRCPVDGPTAFTSLALYSTSTNASSLASPTHLDYRSLSAQSQSHSPVFALETMSNKVLADKDANAAMAEQQIPDKNVKSMEYHRQAFHSKMAQDDTANKYISPSDNIMSPASAKINALRNKHAHKAKPKSLFAQASSKKLQGENPLGTTPAGQSNTS
ncbi:hypothetical protein G7046_g9796 [Stylonectria norvegica]|nr:hypothetical protein G7046_g9796 [Stylonectria norvegica]